MARQPRLIPPGVLRLGVRPEARPQHRLFAEPIAQALDERREQLALAFAGVVGEDLALAKFERPGLQHAQTDRGDFAAKLQPFALQPHQAQQVRRRGAGLQQTNLETDRLGIYLSPASGERVQG